MKTCLRAFRRNQDPECSQYLQAKYQNAKKSYEMEIRKKSEEQKKETESKLMNHQNGKSFWSAFKSLNYVLRIINIISKSDWFKHYKNVFTTPTDYTPISIEIPPEFEPDPILDAEFNVFEVKLAMKRQKPNKAPGKDSVPNEIWKLSTPVVWSCHRTCDHTPD